MPEMWSIHPSLSNKMWSVINNCISNCIVITFWKRYYNSVRRTIILYKILYKYDPTKRLTEHCLSFAETEVSSLGKFVLNNNIECRRCLLYWFLLASSGLFCYPALINRVVITRRITNSGSNVCHLCEHRVYS